VIEGVRLGRSQAEVRVLLRTPQRSILLPVIAANPRQIEAWMPPSAPLGPAFLTVENSGGMSKPASISVVSSELGLFSLNGLGWGPGNIDNLDSKKRRSQNNIESPAQPGQAAEIVATGLGEASQVQILVGGRAARVIELHRATDQGFDSIRFRVPADAPKGCYVPLYARARGSLPTNVVTIAISGSRSGCEMPTGWPRPAAHGARMGVLGVSRTVTAFAAGQPALTDDDAFGAFFENQQEIETNRILLLPPAGTCTLYSALYQVDLGEFVSVAAAIANPGAARTLDAGEWFKISAGDNSRTVPLSRGPGSRFWERLGFDDPSRRRNLPLFLDKPQYAIATAGGSAVPSFSRLLAGLPALDWTNRDELSAIRRDRGLTFQWRGEDSSDLVLLLAASFDRVSTAGYICYCAAKPETGKMSLPTEMLKQFPATGHAGGPLRSGALLLAARLKPGIPPPASGLEILSLVSAFVQARRIDFE
jgi:uncharacterized protein (TIGR03437 family)